MPRKTKSAEEPQVNDQSPAVEAPPAMPTSAVQMYQFKTYWGGDAWAPAPPQIHAGLIALRKAIGGLQAKKQANGPQFAVKSAKDLGIKLRDALDETGHCEHCGVAIAGRFGHFGTPFGSRRIPVSLHAG